MNRLILLVSMALLGASFSAPAAAQDSDENVRYRARTEIDFEDVSVDGELTKPNGAYLLEKRKSNFNPLIRLKTDFTEEMMESVNQIR